MTSTAPTYRFGEFELDLAGFALRRDGAAVRLEKRAFDLLALLVQRAGVVVPREELIAKLWPPNIIIDFDSGLNTLVRKARIALDDSPESPRYIETVPGRGYRFVALPERIDLPTATDPAPAAPSGIAAPQADLPAVDVLAKAAASTHAGEEAEPAKAAGPAGVLRQDVVRPRPSVLVVALTTVAVLALLGVLAGFVPQRPSQPPRIAVLPFENLTGDDRLAYLAAGLAEDTSISLAQGDLANLRVVAIVGPGGGAATQPLAEIGRERGVELVVKSALRLDGSRIRVTSRLLRVADGEQVWSASFDRELTNVLGLQREISTAIAEQVRLRLSPEWQAAIARRQTDSPEAYALYLKGRYEWVQLTPASIRRALEYFRQAAALDPNYALAWAAVAFGLGHVVADHGRGSAEVRPVVLEALRRAEALGPDLVETRYARGYYHLFLELDMPAAVESARAAIALDPNDAQAHLLLGVALSMVGQRVEARDMLRRSRELDPGFALAYANSANIALGAGDTAAALELARQSVAINPDFWVGHLYLGQALSRSGDPQGALRALDDAARLSEGHSLTYLSRVTLLLKLGRQDEARELVNEFEARAARQYVPAYYGAVMHAQLGDVDAAFIWLERAVERRSIGMSGMAKDARLAPLRADPRFAAVLARCGCTGPPEPTP